MRTGCVIHVVIPALNEQEAIGKVLTAIPDWVDAVIVADNGSTDDTAKVAREHGAAVVSQPRRGYGAACLAALAFMADAPRSPSDVVVFLDADYGDHPEQMDRLVDPIVAREADMVIGSRVLGESEPGALNAVQRFGNGLACRLMRLFWRARHTDLGPFRAIRHDALRRLQMSDRGYGWTVQMQVRAARAKLVVKEAPVSYRRRIGRSKISGTLRGVIGAGTKILAVILAEAIDSIFRRKRYSAGRGELKIDNCKL